MAILHSQQFKVWDEGTTVKLMLGNVPVTMDYRAALELAQFLRLSGRRAKSTAGDRSSTFSSMGILTDAETEERRLQKLRDVTASYKAG